MTSFTESDIEILTLDELKALDYSYIPGPSIAPDIDSIQPSFLAEPVPAYGKSEKHRTHGGSSSPDLSRNSPDLAGNSPDLNPNSPDLTANSPDLKPSSPYLNYLLLSLYSHRIAS